MSYDWNDFLPFVPKNETEKNCCTNYVPHIRDGYMSCASCGLLDIAKPLFEINTFNLVSKTSCNYRRIVYFKQKLNYINCLTFYKYSPKMHFFIECNKHKNIKSLTKLRKALHKAGLWSSYKHIYSIYLSITGKQLINIPHSQYPLYISQFLRLETLFKKHNIKKCIYSYSVILYLLMKINGSHEYKYIFLPLNKKRLIKKITELLILCDIK